MQNIAVILTAIGSTTSLFFHVFLNQNHLKYEKPIAVQRKAIEELDSPNSNTRLIQSSEAISRRRFIFSISLLLRVALLYVASRLFITLATVYLPLYIEESNVGGKQALATVPLVSYLSSLIAAFSLKYINRCCGTKVLDQDKNKVFKIPFTWFYTTYVNFAGLLFTR